MDADRLTSDPGLDAALRELARPETTYAPRARIGPYELGDRLGEGGMGVVHRALDLRLGRTVALKLLPSHAAADATRRAWLVREARAAAAIVHANVTAVYDVGDDDGVPYLAMELASGVSLRRELASGVLSVARALGWLRQIAAGLEAAHRVGVVHRDLKPENIVVDAAAGTLKILDFGLSKSVPLEMTPATSAAQASHVTLAGCGTRRYMAPEQAEGREVDARADVYAFGLVACELLTGAPDAARLDRVRGARALVSFVRSCVARERDERPEDGAAVVRALERIDAARHRRRRASIAAASVAAALLVALGARAAGARLASASEAVPPARSPSPPALAPRALTSNSVEVPVLAAAISPDGTSVAYAERRGVFVMRIGDDTAARLVTTANVGSIGFAADGRALFATLQAGEVARIPLDGDGAVQRLGVRGVDVSPAPDGATLAVTSKDGVALVDLRRTGEAPRLVYPHVGVLSHVAWSPSGRSLVVPTFTAKADTPSVGELVWIDVASGKTRIVASDARLIQEVGEIGTAFSAEDRLLVALSPTYDDDGVLREIPLEPGNSGLLRDVGTTGRSAASHLGVSRDGARVAFVRYRSQTDAYVGELGDDATSLAPLRRVTFSEENERPSDFTSEGRLLVVEGGGRTRPRASRIDLATGLGAPALPGAAWATWAVETPARDVLAFRFDAKGPLTADISLTSGNGASRVIARDAPIIGRGRPPPHDAAVRCTARCVLATRATGGASLAVLDPSSLAVLSSATAHEADPSWGIALSRDGSRVAMRDEAADGRALDVFSLDGTRTARVLAPEGCFVQFSAFTPRDDALVATMVCGDDEPFQIRRFPLDGGAGSVLATGHSAWFAHPVVSRDGRRLAVSEMPFDGNVAVLDLAAPLRAAR